MFAHVFVPEAIPEAYAPGSAAAQVIVTCWSRLYGVALPVYVTVGFVWSTLIVSPLVNGMLAVESPVPTASLIVPAFARLSRIVPSPEPAFALTVRAAPLPL